MSPVPGPPPGNVYDKYGTRNPIERRLVRGFLDQLDALVDRTGAREAHEIGCGEGELCVRLAKRGLRVRGTDVSPEVIAEARRRAAPMRVGIDFQALPVEELDPGRDAAELVLCCEVMEHLDGPDAALDQLAGLARPWAIVSVPREPLWRALNHWSRRGFITFLERRFEVVEVHSPFPWTMALCRAR